MSVERSSLNFDDLDDFEAKPSAKPDKATRKKVDQVASFPSREAPQTKQMNITGDASVLDRFDRMCKEDRRSRHAMLEILMDAYEGKG